MLSSYASVGEYTAALMASLKQLLVSLLAQHKPSQITSIELRVPRTTINACVSNARDKSRLPGFFILSCKDRSRMLNLAIVAGVAGVVSVRRGRIESVKSNSCSFFKAESTTCNSSLKLSLSISRSRQGSAASAMIAAKCKSIQIWKQRNTQGLYSRKLESHPKGSQILNINESNVEESQILSWYEKAEYLLLGMS